VWKTDRVLWLSSATTSVGTASASPGRGTPLTPHIDRLVKQGLRIDNLYCMLRRRSALRRGPSCTPALSPITTAFWRMWSRGTVQASRASSTTLRRWGIGSPPGLGDREELRQPGCRMTQQEKSPLQEAQSRGFRGTKGLFIVAQGAAPGWCRLHKVCSEPTSANCRARRAACKAAVKRQRAPQHAGSQWHRDTLLKTCREEDSQSRLPVQSHAFSLSFCFLARVLWHLRRSGSAS